MNMNFLYAKVDTDEVYVAYKLEENAQYKDEGPTKNPYMDGNDYTLHYSRILVFEMEPIYIKKRSTLEIGENVITGISHLLIDDPEEIPVSFNQGRQTSLEKPNGPGKNRKYVFPIELSVLVEELLGEEVPKKMSINQLEKLLIRLNETQGNKNHGWLFIPEDKEKAIRKLSEVRGISKSRYKWKIEKHKPLGLNSNDLVKSVSNDEEVKKIIDKINLISKQHGGVNSKVQKKLENIIKKYHKLLEQTKPRFKRFESEEIELKFTPLKPKTQLLQDLTRLYYSLSSEIKLFDYLDELKTCRTLVEKKRADKNQKLTLLQKDILEIFKQINVFPEVEHVKVVEKLQKMIDKQINEVSADLDMELNDKQKREINIEREKKFKTQIRNLRAECEEKASLYRPYAKFQMTLLSNSTQIFPHDKGLTKITKSILLALNSIENEHLKEEEKKKYEELRNKYIQKANEKLLDGDNLTSDDFTQFQKEYYEELKPLVNELFNISTKSLNQVISKGSLRVQLQNSLDLLIKEEKEKKEEEKENHSKEPITSYTQEINDLITDEVLDVKGELVNLLQNQLDLLEKKEINNYGDYDKARAEILGQLAKFHLDLVELKADIKDHKNQTIDKIEKK